MKKIVLTVMLLLVLALVACAPQQERVVKTSDAVAEIEEEPVVEEEPAMEEAEVEEAPEDEPIVEKGPVVDEEPKKELSISQDELDQLGADLEAMEFEDLGGLSE